MQQQQYKRTLTKNLYQTNTVGFGYRTPGIATTTDANRAGSYVRVWSMDIMKMTTKKDYGYNWIRSCHTLSPKILSLIIGIINSPQGFEMLENIISKARRVGLNSYVVWARQTLEGRSTDETFVNKVLNKIETDRWSAQFQRLLLKTIEAQSEYIKLLERRIDKESVLS